MAQDSAGNLGLGYSTSGSSIYPGVAVTGLESGADGGMETESVIYNGPNFQDIYSRWGDYSSMAVDPHDDGTLVVHDGVFDADKSLRNLQHFLGNGDRQLSFSELPCQPVNVCCG
jgi:hypothetical protein